MSFVCKVSCKGCKSFTLNEIFHLNRMNIFSGINEIGYGYSNHNNDSGGDKIRSLIACIFNDVRVIEIFKRGNKTGSVVFAGG